MPTQGAAHRISRSESALRLLLAACAAAVRGQVAELETDFSVLSLGRPNGRRRKRKRVLGIERLQKMMATGPNQSWSMDFVSDGFVDVRRAVSVLARVAEVRGLPKTETVDSGPELSARPWMNGRIVSSFSYGS